MMPKIPTNGPVPYPSYGKALIDITRDDIIELERIPRPDVLASLCKEYCARLRLYEPATATASLSKYLAQANTHDCSGHRTVGDLTYDELGTLNRDDMLCVARALTGVLRMKDIELARAERDRWTAQVNYASAMVSRAEEREEIAGRRSRGEPT